MYNVLLIIEVGIIAVNILYIWLSGIFAVVKSTVNDTLIEPVLISYVVCIQISSPLYD